MTICRGSYAPKRQREEVCKAEKRKVITSFYSSSSMSIKMETRQNKEAKDKCEDCRHARELHRDWYDECLVQGCLCMEFEE